MYVHFHSLQPDTEVIRNFNFLNLSCFEPEKICLSFTIILLVREQLVTGPRVVRVKVHLSPDTLHTQE